jgi:predicted nicotinamide N-methyase
VLVAYLNKHFSKWSTLIKDKVVLEVGAGTGIVGLACNLFHPKTLILTDFKENLELLKHNS